MIESNFLHNVVSEDIPKRVLLQMESKFRSQEIF